MFITTIYLYGSKKLILKPLTMRNDKILVYQTE